MSNTPKSLMRYYAEGAIISRELEQMMHDFAAEARFDRELAEETELYRNRHLHRTYGDD